MLRPYCLADSVPYFNDTENRDCVALPGSGCRLFIFWCRCVMLSIWCYGAVLFDVVVIQNVIRQEHLLK